MARRALADVPIPTIAAGTRWIVEVKAVEPHADTVLRYLGRYVHRTALGEGAIVACTDETVTFRYRDSRTHEQRTMTLPAHEFLRRFLQHVLPKGLHRVRSYGLLHPTRRTALRRLQLLLDDGRVGELAGPESETNDTPPRFCCPHCRGALVIVRRLSAVACYAMAEILAATPPSARGPPPPSPPPGTSPP